MKKNKTKQKKNKYVRERLVVSNHGLRHSVIHSFRLFSSLFVIKNGLTHAHKLRGWENREHMETIGFFLGGDAPLRNGITDW